MNKCSISVSARDSLATGKLSPQTLVFVMTTAQLKSKWYMRANDKCYITDNAMLVTKKLNFVKIAFLFQREIFVFIQN